MSLKEKILQASLHLERFYVPEFASDICMRRMTGDERLVWAKAHVKMEQDAKDKGDAVYLELQPLLLSMTLCDENGKKIFGTVDEIKKIDAVVIDRLAIKAMEVNCLTLESQEALKKKLLEKNTSTSGSPTV